MIFSLAALILTATHSASTQPAAVDPAVEILGPGLYHGRVVFDRFGACLLHRGGYFTYVSEQIKQQLKHHQGSCLHVDASKVVQPVNPGNARIESLSIRKVTDSKAHVARIEGLSMVARMEVSDQGRAQAFVTIQNSGPKAIELRTDYLAPLVTAKRSETNATLFEASDGPSFAALHGHGLLSPLAREAKRTKPMKRIGDKEYHWRFLNHQDLGSSLALEPGTSQTFQLEFDLPDGEYDFLFGYDERSVQQKQIDWHAISSNLVAFDVKNRTAKLVQVPGRD